VALALSLILYIYWYVEVSTGFRAVMEKNNLDPGQFLKSQTWMVILTLSILVGIILIGIIIIFVYTLKTLQLYRLQNNFINNFTHELKTPVTSLKLYLETFLKHELSRNDQHKYLNYMIHDVERLSENINRILDLAKFESKDYEGNFVMADIYKTIEGFYKENSHLFRDCEINVHNPLNRSFTYWTNPFLFKMLLMNLSTNAVKYNEAKTPRIDITFALQKHKLHIRFEDNGIGIETSEIKKIFKKFYQVGKSDNMTAKGSGLGLYLVHSIARLHKGKVVAESKGLGQGSAFTLILPFQTA
jgi:two-component system phosphate regulon sensor histidine kinase PhoR